MSYRDQRLELGGVNTHGGQPPVDIQDWQNATEDMASTTSEEQLVATEDQTSVTDSTVSEEMEEHKSVGDEDGLTVEERRRRLLALADNGKMSVAE